MALHRPRGSQSMVPGPGAAASPGNSLEMQILRPHPGLAEAETLRLGPSTLCFNMPSRGCHYSCGLGTTTLAKPISSSLSVSPPAPLLDHPRGRRSTGKLAPLGSRPWGLEACVFSPSQRNGAIPLSQVGILDLSRCSHAH